MIQFGADICGSITEAREKEWLETNGIGGFAMSTIVGLNTRRYHGLLVAATKPPTERLMLLNKLDETLVVRLPDGSERRIDLAVNEFSDDRPARLSGHQIGFRLDPFPIFTFAVDGWVIEKAIWLAHGQNTVCVQYAVTRDPQAAPGAKAELRIRPLISCRDFHTLAHENPGLNVVAEVALQQVTVRPYADAPALRISHNADSVDPTPYWYRHFHLQVEQDRGYDHIEDLHGPVELRFQIGDAPDQLCLIASTSPIGIAGIDELRRAEVARRAALVEAAPYDDAMVCALTAAADQFIVTRGDRKSIIAGYPWFSDWGRDTMIALPGLTLATGRFDVARDILVEYARHMDQGMIPNRFPDKGDTPEYNTVDATLWMFEATRALSQYSQDEAFVREHLYEPLADAIAWHERGTRYNIRMDTDGLLHAGAPGMQLTWMDAKYRDWVVTPRMGKPVEIQALWFNALQIMRSFAARFGDTARALRYGDLAGQAELAFNAQFWNEEAGCLYDVVDGTERDASIRPNQIFAASLTHTMLNQERMQRVVDVVARDLLTPYGLRSLSPADSRYRGRYAGDLETRDGAYHQGTIWAWLMGPFITAHVRAHERSAAARQQARRWLNGMLPHLNQAGLGQISEVFDGYAPHLPGGCVAQAWSVAEFLRSAIEDI